MMSTLKVCKTPKERHLGGDTHLHNSLFRKLCYVGYISLGESQGVRLHIALIP